MSLKETITDFAYRVYRILRIIFLLVLFFALIAFYIYLQRPGTLPINRVQVVGSYSYVDKGMLEDLITPYAKSGFFSIKIIELQQSLLQLPWLGAVQVRRIWPNTVLIILTVRTPVAHWENGNLLDDNAVIFTPEKGTELPLGLPDFSGPTESAEAILTGYQEMNRSLRPLQLYIIKIQVSQRKAWVLTLNNGIVLYLGREKLAERLQRFINAYPQTIHNKVDQIVSVDLRYDNGFSVAWRK